MKFFSYEKAFIASHGNPELLLDYYRGMNEGENFIVNPKSLVEAFWVSDRHKAEYLGICALRSYNDYATKGDVDVSLDLLPAWIPLAIIEENPLLKLTETKIILEKEKI